MHFVLITPKKGGTFDSYERNTCYHIQNDQKSKNAIEIERHFEEKQKY